MATVTIYTKAGRYVTPHICCVCGSSRVSTKLQLTETGSFSHYSGTRRVTRRVTSSVALPVCPEHVRNPTGIHILQPTGIETESTMSSFTVFNLSSNYAQALLRVNLQTAVQDAKYDPSYRLLEKLADYYDSNTELQGVVAMFNELGVGEMIEQGLESGLLEEHITTVWKAITFERTLADLKGIERGIELANRLMRKAVDKSHKFGEADAQKFLKEQHSFCRDYRPEIVGFLHQVLRDNSLTGDIQGGAVSALASCEPTQLEEALHDEDLNVKVRFDIIQGLRDHDLRVEDPDFIEKFYARIKDDRELSVKMRREAAAALGAFKAILMLAVLETLPRRPTAVAIGLLSWIILCGGFSGALLAFNTEPRISLALSLGISLAPLGVFILVLANKIRGKLGNARWYQKHGRGDLGENQ